jgi:hypothetical protein
MSLIKHISKPTPSCVLALARIQSYFCVKWDWIYDQIEKSFSCNKIEHVDD